MKCKLKLWPETIRILGVGVVTEVPEESKSSERSFAPSGCPACGDP